MSARTARDSTLRARQEGAAGKRPDGKPGIPHWGGSSSDVVVHRIAVAMEGPAPFSYVACFALRCAL